MKADCVITEQGSQPVLKTAGLLFDVKRFAIHDGPGIRTTVFFKGCPLSCAWCHNPESQHAAPELLLWRERCLSCGACIEACPQGAIRWEGGTTVTERGRCTGCGACVHVCRVEARSLVGTEWTVDAVMCEIEKDVLFYDESGGGVTCSGGEPLFQPEFCVDLLRACHHRRLHTAVDTCGFAERAILRAVADHTDLFLYDVKLMDPGRHVSATGVENVDILSNLQTLDRWGKRLWIRFPLIPGINDDARNVSDLGRLVRSLRHAEGIQILPYHRVGEGKLIGLGEDREERGFREPSAAEVEAAVERLRGRVDVPVTIGG